jgi:hypothetical protein
MESEGARQNRLERQRQWRMKNAEHKKAYQKEWRAKNVESVKEYQAAYQAEYTARDEIQAKTRQRHLQKNYRLTTFQFNEMWEEQNGKCAICCNSMAPRGRKADAVTVDHNHATGEVRGLLCRACNHGIGNLKDNPDVLANAAKYLSQKGHYSHLRKERK